MIRIQGLHKYFNKGRQNEIHVIDGIDLELPEKGMTAIFGKSGCGKTTLLNVIGGLDSFASGSVTIEQRDVRTNTDDLRNRYIGYIFQNYNLHKEESCFENVAAALRLCGMNDEAEIERRVMAALRNVGMEKYAKRPPNTLSGGQQQRIAIARAIVKNPRIILADEPTGNLDEANTVMIMDLLKSISENHLVLLVTHEAHLVDHYCDTVIELSDGRIVDIRNNKNADGYSVKDKNHIYLGELEKTEISDEKAHIEYYGDAPEQPISLRIVNHGGKLFVEIQNEKVHILDSASEVRLMEGVFEETAKEKNEASHIDMSALPPVEATKTGALFSFSSSIKSGYAINFKKNKRGKKVLRSCMCMFAAIIVLMTAIFGTAIGNIMDANDSFNHNMFYVYTPDGEVSDRLVAALQNGEGSIDALRLHYYYPDGDEWIDFRVGGFETFSMSYYSSTISTQAAFLEHSMTKDLALLAGTAENLNDSDILITRKVADMLLEQSSYGHITEYRDLIGMISSTMQTKENKNPRITGVLESDELAVYFSENMLAKYTFDRVGKYSDGTVPGSDYGINVNKGEVVLFLNDIYEQNAIPTIGQKIKISGAEFTVARILRQQRTYEEWLNGNGIKKLTQGEWMANIVRTEYPNIAEGSDDFHQKLANISNLCFSDYYDYYYEYLDDFLYDLYRFDRSIELWMYFERNCENIRYHYTPTDYYLIQAYRQLYGKTPTYEELNAVRDSLPMFETIDYYSLYEEEYYEHSQNFNYLDEHAYLVCDEDYAMLSKRIGETHESVKGLYYEGDIFYTAIHSSDPSVTKEWLISEFPDLTTNIEYMKPILTPELMFERILEGQLADIIGGLIAIAVLLTIMSVCMYFIMRSALMNRIKEVGIYRAIGVSKKNLVFRFFTESLVLTTLTVFLGYLATSAFIFICMELSPLVAEVFFYPVWLAGTVLTVLYALSLVCGTLPILSLLRKTPSEILAKYDI